MERVQHHYESLLAPIYVWMAGGMASAIAAGSEDIADLLPGGGLAVDLGAGFGMHSIPLARAGYEVVAIDTSPHLLDVLRRHDAGLPIRAVEANLLDFSRYIERPARLVVCLGDTLTHLADPMQVDALFRDVADTLERGGRLMLTFRDYSRPATGDARFIPVRSDDHRIHTCFVEALSGRMRVHDIVHERIEGSWRMRVGSYEKLRLPPQAIEQSLRVVGLVPTVSVGARGMVRIMATRP